MSELLLAFLWIVGLLPIVYLFFYSAYWMLSLLLGAGYKTPKLTGSNSDGIKDMLVLLPAYKPNDVFIEVLQTLKKAIGQKVNIKPVILLQEADPKITKAVKAFGYFTLEKEFSHLQGNPYHHALKYLMNEIETKAQTGKWQPSHVVILDKDNLVAEDFFVQLEQGLKSGYDLVQGQRLALQESTTTQTFDSISETLNDLMFRAAKSRLGLTLEISGSGFALNYNVMRSAVNRLDGLAPGMDKNLMIGILQHPIKSLYIPEAKVFEEKTETAEAIQKQRTRWLGAQYYIAWVYGWALIKMGLKTLRLSPIDYAISLWRPPRSMQLFLIPFLAIIEMGISLWLGAVPYEFPFMSVSFGMLILAFFVFVQKAGLWNKLVAIVIKLPNFAIGNMGSAIEGVKPKNRGAFIHTEHTNMKSYEK